jgi:periplasmic copper chaperone A
MRRAGRALLATVGAVLVAVFGFAGAAAAHVTISPGEAEQGGEAQVAFNVPTESDTAATTKVEIVIPTDAPIASVSLLPVSGWTATTTTSKLAKPVTNDDGDQVTEAVSRITWTADSPATAIKPGQYQLFNLSLGPLPKTNQVVFKVLQTYSDGKVVRWIEESQPGQPEPDNPAPVLKLVPPGSGATAGGSDDGAAAPPPASAPSAGPAAAPAASDSDGTARALGIAGLVLGAVGAGLGALALARRRQPT